MKRGLIFLVLVLMLAVPAGFLLAETNIDSTNKWAWNDSVGWMDLNATGNVELQYSKMTGYASSSIGYIAFDCATSPNGDICTTSNFSVTHDGAGNLSGWAWNDQIGWISFDCNNSGQDCNTSDYQVRVDSSGYFWGWAWNDQIGWISFNCINNNSCSISDYYVESSYNFSVDTGNMISSIIDSGVSSGVTLNSIIWQGTKPTATKVKFQIASSNSSDGPWNYLGPDSSDLTYYEPTGPGVQLSVNLSDHANKRYFRYKVFLESNIEKTLSPTVEKVILNWSE